MIRSASVASLAFLLAAPAPATAAAPPAGHEPGVYWEQSLEMQMAGFAMPAQTMKLCMPKRQWDEPPRSGKDGDCEMKDVKRSGSRITWKVVCKDGSSGEGDMTYSSDAYSGAMTMRSQGQEMRMKMKGKKLGGDCDAGEVKRKAAEVRQQIDDQKALQEQGRKEQCDKAVDEMQLYAFVPITRGLPANCADRIADFCHRLETRQGFVAFERVNGQPDAPRKAEKLCDKDLAEVKASLCAAAAKDQQKGKKLEGDSVEFVFASCPEQANALAKRECAGRSFTSMPRAQAEFCTKFARKALDAGEQEEAPQKAPEASDVKQRILKGLFGR